MVAKPGAQHNTVLAEKSHNLMVHYFLMVHNLIQTTTAIKTSIFCSIWSLLFQDLQASLNQKKMFACSAVYCHRDTCGCKEGIVTRSDIPQHGNCLVG